MDEKPSEQSWYTLSNCWTYLKSATTAIAADEIRKTCLLPCNCHKFDERDFLEESQRTITGCLLESPVPRTNISEQPSTTSGTNPQTLTDSLWECCMFCWLFLFPAKDISNRTNVWGQAEACFTKHPCCFSALRHWSYSRYRWQETRTVNKTCSIPTKDLLLFWRLALQTKLQEDLKRKETRDQREFSKIRLAKEERLRSLWCICFSSLMINTRWEKEEIIWVITLRPRRLWGAQSSEADEENSDNDAACFYCSGLYCRHRRDE